MRPGQGSASLAAGNTFNGSSNLLYNIYNPPSEVGGINYYHSGGASDPPNTFGSVNEQLGNLNSCQPPSDYPPYWTPPKGLQGFRLGGNRSVPDPLYYYLHGDTDESSRDSLYYWAEQWQSPYGDLLRVDMMIEDDRAGDADALYDEIVSAYDLEGPEAEEFENYGRDLISLKMDLTADGKSDRDLNVGQVQTLEAIVEGATMWAKVRAQAWLSLYDGREFENTFLFPESDEPGEGQYRMAGGREENSPSADASSPLVYPNPASKHLTVRYTPADGLSTIILVYDLMGHTVLSAPIAAGETHFNVSALPVGTYLWRIVEGGTEKQKGKFVKE